jgi:hypothetical protein
LTLLWSVSLEDSLFPDFMREVFAPMECLPFYMCWKCMSASYYADGSTKLTCLPFDYHSHPIECDDSPYQNAPNELPSRRIGFERIPSTIDAILTLKDDVGFDTLDSSARQTLTEYYGEEVRNWNLIFSQLGGQFLLYQGHPNRVCPNPKCPASKLKHPYGELEVDYLMKELAMLFLNDIPELEKEFFQLVYYVCCTCFSIRAEYQCT